MIKWQDLLARIRSVKADVWGPYSKEMGSAIVALQDAPWFERVGQPIQGPASADVVRVASWGEALSIFREGEEEGARYSALGHLEAATYAVLTAADRAPERREWISRAYRLARETVNVHTFVPGAVPSGLNSDLGDHVHQYQQYLLTEIAVQDLTPCSFFREQLAWYFAGHFPCGWEGVWPEGRHRVF